MDIAVRIFTYMIFVTIIRFIFGKKNENIKYDNIIKLPDYTVILNISAVISITLAVVLEFLRLVFNDSGSQEEFIIAEMIFFALSCICILISVYIKKTIIIFDDDKFLYISKSD